MPDVEVYSSGIFCCSVCAPEEMSKEQVEQRVNKVHPCGTESGWTISEDKHFSDGTTENGGVVECQNGTTRHWLLNA